MWQDTSVDYPNLKKFLPAFFVYSTAIQTVVLIATYFGEEEINWPSAKEKTIGLIVSILIIQIIAILVHILLQVPPRDMGT